MIFETEDKAFAEGGFRMAYKAKSDDESFNENAWAVKKYSMFLKEAFEKMGETCEPQSPKAVQMHCLPRYFSFSFSKAVLKIYKDFGECLNCNHVLFVKKITTV